MVADENEIWLLDNRNYVRLNTRSLAVISGVEYRRREIIELSPAGNSFVLTLCPLRLCGELIFFSPQRRKGRKGRKEKHKEYRFFKKDLQGDSL